ncbi:hypothetical protein JXR93_09905 [bacterium]|nr:hypothetical protein [bacterium]
MSVEKIKGSSFNLAMQKAKQMFDDDPVILDTNTLSIDGKTFYEITVSGKKREQQDDISVKENAQRIVQLVKNMDDGRKSDTRAVNQSSEIFSPSSKNSYNSESITKVNNSEFQKKSFYSNEFNSNSESKTSLEILEMISGVSHKDILSIPKHLINIYISLINQGVTHSIAFQIVQEAEGEIYPNMDKDDMIHSIQTILYDNISVSGSLYEKRLEQRVVALMGTSGVGKSTTLAKMASEAVLSYGKKTAIFSFDFYKTATIEQLKSYSSLLKIPLEIINSEEDYFRKTVKYSNYDLILVDTEGINIFDEYQFNSLNRVLSFFPKTERHLLFSVNMKDKDLIRIYKKFKSLSPEYLIFSKLDESSELGSILNMNILTDLPISFLTNGTRVPGDLVTASKKYITKLLLNF